MTYDELLVEADKNALIVKEKPIKGNDGRIKGNRIAIRKDALTINKACALTEELGHYHTSFGNIIDMKDIRNRKQEWRARLWAYNKQIGLIGIVSAYKHRCKTIHDTAEYLDVTEEFLTDAIKCYKEKYGSHVIMDNYIIYFEPNLAVLEMV